MMSYQLTFGPLAQRFTAILLLCFCVVFAACSTSKPYKDPNKSTANQGGAYYKDDGPSRDVPANLASTPDPVPTIEPLAKYANRSYEVMGKTYTPIVDDDKKMKQRGKASWYGKKFHGRKTASGEIYDMYKLSAAHTTLPIPSFARVRNLANGKEVVVRVNDRGPFHSDRIIDLSYTAALKLDILKQGSVIVEVERILPSEITSGKKSRMAEQESNQAEPESVELTKHNDEVKVKPSAIATSIALSPLSSAKNNGDILKNKSEIYLQLAAFSSYANAEKYIKEIQSQLDAIGDAAENLVCRVEESVMSSSDAKVFRVRCGPYENKSTVETLMQRLEKIGKKAIVVL